MSENPIRGNSIGADGSDSPLVGGENNTHLRLTNGTDYVYNGVLIRRAITNSVDRTVRYDTSGVNAMYVETVINISARLFDISFDPAAADGDPGGVPYTEHGINDHVPDFIQGEDHGKFVSLSRYVLQRLSIPRRRFIWRICNEPMMDVRPLAVEFGTVQGDVGGTDPRRTQSHTNGLTSRFGLNQVANKNKEGSDINNGPKCEARIEKITQYSMTLNITFTVCTPVCGDFIPSPGELANNRGTNLAQGLVSFRWWIDEDIGDNFLTTRIYRGRIRVASTNQNLHFMVRNLIIIPPLQGGFARKKISYSEHPNGMELDYVILDREEMNAPPSPAVKWTGNHSLQTAIIQKKPVATSSLDFTLTGGLNTNQRQLLELGVRIIDAKTHILSRYGAGAQPSLTDFDYRNFQSLNTTVLMVGFSVTAPLTGENTVHFNAQFMHMITGAGTATKSDSDEEGVSAGEPKQNNWLNLMSAIGFGRSLEYTNISNDDRSPMKEYNFQTNDYDTDYDAQTFPEMQLRRNNNHSGRGVQTAALSGLFLSVIHDACRPPIMPQTRSASLDPGAISPGDENTKDREDKNEEESAAKREPHPLNPYPARLRNESAYVTYEVDNDYDCVQPKVALPVGYDSTAGGNNPTYKIVDIFGERAKRTLNIKAMRINAPPELVKPEEFTDVNGIVCTPVGSAIVSPAAPTFEAAGLGAIYEMEQVVTFAMSRPPSATDTMQLGKVQYVARTQRDILDKVFKHGDVMIKPGQSRSPV